MIKSKIIISISILGMLIFFQTDKIKNPVLNLFNSTKKEIIHSYENLNLWITRYFNQAETIEKLTKENQRLKNNIENIYPLLSQCKELKYFKDIKHKNLKFTETISYAKLPILSQIYINYEFNDSKVRGLIYNNSSAGLVIKQKGKFSLAFLNSDVDTVYAVYISDKEIPGILFGGKKIFIKYIPKYHKINIGDEVITSGVDNIFYKGLKVGRVEKVIQKDLYQEVEIIPYYNSFKPTFFYVVE